jgi:hypothetical protein
LDASLDELGIWRVQQYDDGAGGFPRDLVDQSQRVPRIRSESDERDVGSFPGGHRPTSSASISRAIYLMAQSDDNRGEDRKTILALVCDQDV